MKLNASLKRGTGIQRGWSRTACRGSPLVDLPVLSSPLELDHARRMNAIFVYDDDAPVLLSVDRQEEDIRKQIVAHGGQVTGVLHSHFHIGRLGRSSISLRKVPFVHPIWVTRSVKAKTMIPMYEYVEETQKHALGLLSPEQRDLAEMIKAMAQLSSRQVFKILHQRLPHKTSDEWRSLYQDSLHGIDEVVAGMRSQIEHAVEEKSNEIILDLFSSPALHIRRRSPSMDTVMQDYSAHRRIKEDVADTDDTEGEDQSAEEVCKAVLGRRNQAGARIKGKPKTTARASIKRVKMTPDDINAMVRFVKNLGREPYLSDWQVFYNLRAENQRRTAAAWNTHYSMKRELITDTIERLNVQ